MVSGLAPLPEKAFVVGLEEPQPALGAASAQFTAGVVVRLDTVEQVLFPVLQLALVRGQELRQHLLRGAGGADSGFGPLLAATFWVPNEYKYDNE